MHIRACVYGTSPCRFTKAWAHEIPDIVCVSPIRTHLTFAIITVFLYKV